VEAQLAQGEDLQQLLQGAEAAGRATKASARASISALRSRMVVVTSSSSAGS
jgi:hypothetical protein